jgi:cysteine desulfurase
VIYLDNAATTKVAPEVLAAMLPLLGERFGNPSSVSALGALAKRDLEEAREAVAAALGAEPGEVVFTSGGTEASTLAVQGAALALRRRGDHVVTTAVEHRSVHAALEPLERDGLRVTRVAPGSDGRLDPDAVLAAVTPQTILVSVMHVQNETGAVFPLDEVARRVKGAAPHALVHGDGVQALGKLPPPGRAVDLYSVSAHKVHGPKGAGALLIRKGARVVPLLPGGQEGGRRGGTEAMADLVGFGAAARLAAERRAAFVRSATRLNEALRAGFALRGGVVNSPPDGVPSILNVSFVGAPAEPLLHALEARGVVVSTGAACHSKSKDRSPVLRAMGLDERRLASALRFSLSRETTDADVEATLAALDLALAEVAPRRATK